MARTRSRSVIDKVVYNFKKRSGGQIDIVPIAARLLTPVNITRTSAPHRTDFHRVIWFQHGEPTHIVDFDKIAVKSPAMLLVHKDRIHQFDVNNQHDGKVLIFTDDFFARTPANSGFLKNTLLFNHPSGAYLVNNPGEQLNRLFDFIEEEIQRGEYDRKSDILHSLLCAFLYSAESTIARQPLENGRDSSRATLAHQFMELLEQNYSRRLSMGKYCDLLNVTPSTLNQALSISTGKTGKKLVTDRVVLEAKRLLAYSDLNVQQVGFELGFEQPTNFIKFFHVNTGQTPLAYKRAKK